MTGIIDYNAGNISSVARALSSLGLEFSISKRPEELATAERLIIPGVGEAAFAMNQLKKSGYDSFIIDAAKKGIPILGICLGSQIVMDYSEEGNVDCLGLIPGKVRHFPDGLPAMGLKIPHMGWNNISYRKTDPLFSGIRENSDFYFVHSYYLDPSDIEDITGVAEYGIEFSCALNRKNIFALQFHPEKSGKQGLKILGNFATLTKESFGC